MSIGTRLIILVLVAALPIVALQVHDQVEQREMDRSAIATQALTIADLQAERLSHIVETARGIAVTAARMSEVLEHDSARCSARFGEILERFPEFAGIGAIDSEGSAFCASSGNTGANVGDRSYFQQVLEEKRFIASSYIIGRSINRPTIVFVAPALDDSGEVSAVVLVSYPLERVSAILSRATLPNGASASLIGPDGVVVARVPTPDAGGGDLVHPLWGMRVGRPLRGATAAAGPDGVERMYGYAPLADPAKFHAVIGIPLRPALARLDAKLWRNLGILAVVFALAMVAALIVGNRGIRRPLDELQRVARAVAAGDLGARTRPSRGAAREVVAVGRSLDGMARAIEARETALRSSEAFNRRVLESSRDSIKVLSLGGRLLSINRYGREVFGVGKDEEIVGRPYAEFWAGDDRAAAEAALAEARTGGTARFQARHVGRSGREMWWDVAVTPMPDAEGTPERLLVVSRDITGLKDAEMQRELLMAELDHRVKNMLAAIQAIASRTLPREPRTESFKHRVDAMAKAHHLLSLSNWQGADLGQLLRDLLAAHGESIRYSGPAVRLDPRATQTLGTVIHELSMNATKYGALSVPGGHVAVDWRVKAGPGHHLVVEWTEHDGPKPRAPRDRGFGLTLVERNVEHELKGSARIDFDPGGLVCVIEVPAERSVVGGVATWSVDRAQPDGGPRAGKLTDCRILLVEDMLIVAMDVEAVLVDAGARTIGPARSVEEGLRLCDENPVDAAVLDVNLDGQPVFPLAARLAEAGVPFIFMTGYDGRSVFPPEFRDVPRIGKPVATQALIEALESVIADRSDDDASRSGGAAPGDLPATLDHGPGGAS